MTSRANERSGGVCVVGAMPPPMHGMAAVNAYICDVLRKEGAFPLAISLSPGSLSRSLLSRMKRIAVIITGLGRFVGYVLDRRCDTLYVGLSGGLGQLYELLFILIARLAGWQIYLHHHSFAYIEKFSLISWIMFAIAGTKATHITLSIGMANAIRKQYPSCVHNALALSNAAFLPESNSTESSRRDKVVRVGFLGNISEAKGILEFLEVAAELERRNVSIEMKVAGPFEDNTIARKVTERMAVLKTIEYLGPKYGAAKTQYLMSLDALLFPSRYQNEAEPLVIHEAMRTGLPVIATPRGAIGEVITQGAGRVVSSEKAFVNEAVETLLMWNRSPSEFSMVSQRARERFDMVKAEGGRALKEFCKAVNAGLRG